MGQSTAEPPPCVVSGTDKLPAEIGSSRAICAAILDAVQQKVPGALRAVDVQILSSSSLSATVTLADGRRLPEQKMAVSDRQLDRGSIERFAAAIARQIEAAIGH